MSGNYTSLSSITSYAQSLFFLTNTNAPPTECLHATNLQHSSLTSKIALEYLQEFIYNAYTFYTALLKRNTLLDYCTGWLEALGDLTQYCIVITAMVPAVPHGSSSLTTAAVSGRFWSLPVGSTLMYTCGSMMSISSQSIEEPEAQERL
ncbi:hypothetical protein DFH94DRAFT_848945 [Russula ochroleuca]|uniref:Uncharacterized protein n=1 Tax=Russula ochroleuca TaxID=152965 RepID=A0A9P5JV93_9AGAM|nr:hypothetical protein DFH94DRAFT_848945 [Russula ochroleuca]